MSDTLESLRIRYAELCAQLPPDYSLHVTMRVLHTEPQHDGSPHVEVIGEQYHYVVTERGSELQRRATTDEDELFYWLMADVTHSLASDFEVQHQVEGKDARRLLFSKQLELLGLLKKTWAERRATELEEVLAQHPYRDEV